MKEVSIHSPLVNAEVRILAILNDIQRIGDRRHDGYCLHK